jgi:hypothetical protein
MLRAVECGCQPRKVGNDAWEPRCPAHRSLDQDRKTGIARANRRQELTPGPIAAYRFGCVDTLTGSPAFYGRIVPLAFRAKLTEHRVGDFAVGLNLLFARNRLAFGVVDRPRVPEQIAEIEKSDSGENETKRPQGQPDPHGRVPPDTANQGTKSR